MVEIVLKDESFAVMGACFEVHNVLGTGFLEAVYQEALAFELTQRGIPFISQPELRIRYKQQLLTTTYKPDFICFNALIIELKAVSEVDDVHRAQVHNYLKAPGYRLGLLINFHSHPKLAAERIVR